MKTLEDSNSSEFSIRDFSEIKKDKLLKQKEVLKEKESVFSKSSNGKWKFLFQRKKKSVMPSDPYIVCQQLQVILYQSLSFFNQLKFVFSEKATKFAKIFIVLLTRASCSVRATAYLSKRRRRFFKTNVDKLYYTNFTVNSFLVGPLKWKRLSC